SSAAGSVVAMTWACGNRSAMRLAPPEVMNKAEEKASAANTRCPWQRREGGLSTKFSTFLSTGATPGGHAGHRSTRTVHTPETRPVIARLRYGMARAPPSRHTILMHGGAGVMTI